MHIINMVYCSVLKYLKLFYLSLASFHASTTLVKDNNNKVVAFQNMIRSPTDGINHKYTFIANSSYAKCFREPREITWLYKDGQSGFRVVSFSSSITPTQKRVPTTTPAIRIPTPSVINPSLIKPVTRSSQRIIPPKLKPYDSDTSSDEE